MKISGLWAFGNINNRPVHFKGYNIVLNWSFCELKAEIIGDRESLSAILDFYDGVAHDGEWIGKFTKPVAWVEISSEEKIIRDKSWISTTDISQFLHNKNWFKISIYFEPIINPYRMSWVYAIGGLHHIVDPALWLEKPNGETIKGERVISPIPATITIPTKDYTHENIKSFVNETIKTANELTALNRHTLFVHSSSV